MELKIEDIIKEILHKQNISFDRITKAASGFTNLVYFVDEKYVIKMSKDKMIKKKLDKETLIYKNVRISCMPEFVASGTFNGYKFLIISKLCGKSLYSVWHTLSANERLNCVRQIANILKSFNSQNYVFLNDEDKHLNWIDYLSKQLKSKVVALEGMGIDATPVDNFIFKRLPKLFAENKFGLVYNDAHFDNFIYYNKKVYLIDFDRVTVSPIDYEMLIFKTMCDNPSKFASEEDEHNIKDEDYSNIYEQFKVEYPKMFEIENVEERIAVYQFDYLLGQAIKCNDKKWASKLLEKFVN